MRSNAIFVIKVMVISAIASAVIKYVCPYIPAIVNISLSVWDLNAIALGAIGLPIGLFALLLWWNR
ncbi:hypothetical protein [Pseudanabaena sp. PCC 6802]|uniref:hypothetical protein n=1 Tax=Pseudanabaena sp. PCC 6802 TaxID=118173 RepID=UPI00034CF3EB|nr:hypothetical protein [Pseudanabaena sp. PCC 6802]